eukprot:INCI16346.9.p1 GENE.INCI16346.9~~INCI16346.9.p1  ORF type:complete len:362 (-),score=56.07 INCI16346.9:996-2081(-)
MESQGPAEPGAAASTEATTNNKMRRALFNAIFSEKLLLNKNHAQAAQVLKSLVQDTVPGAALRRRLLLEFRDTKGGNLVHDFAAVGNLDCCRVLVQDVGVDINFRRKKDQCTPLHVAVWNEHPHVLEGLLQLGGDALIQNAFGETAHDTAVLAVAKPNKSLHEGDGEFGESSHASVKPRKGRHDGQRGGRGAGRGGRSEQGRGRGRGRGGGKRTAAGSGTSIGSLASKICSALSEPNRILVMQAVRCMGPEFCEALLRETLDVESKGGMMIEPRVDGAAASSKSQPRGQRVRRRRSPGGVFLFLLRQRCSPEQWKAITQTPRHMKRQRRKKYTARKKKDVESSQAPSLPQPEVQSQNQPHF